MAEGRYEEVIRLARQLQSIDPDQASGYYFEGYALTRQSPPNYPESIRLLKQALGKNPKSKQILYALSLVYLKDNQDDEAFSLLTDAIRRHPDFFEAHALLANITFNIGDYQTAVQHLEKALSIRESPVLYSKLGKAYFQLGKKEAAEEALAKALEFAPLEEDKLLSAEGLYEYVGGDLEESGRKLKSAVEQNPELYETRALLVWNLLDQGRYQDAAAEAQEGIKYHPENQEVFLNLLAQAYLNQDMATEAEKALTRALEKDPDFMLTRLNLSAVYFRQGRYDKTEAELHEILKRSPEYLQAKILLGRVYQATGQDEKAEQHLLELMRSESSDPNSEVRLLQEMILLQIRMRNMDRALQETDKLIARYPESVSGYMLKGQIYALAGNFPMAFNAIDTGLEKTVEKRMALAIGANLAAATRQYKKSLQYLQSYKSEYGIQTLTLKYLYARALIGTGQYQEARDYIKDVLPQKDDRANYLVGLNWIMEGDPEKAEEYLERATGKNSRLADAFFELARVKSALRKQRRAITLLEKAIELNPENERYYLTLAQIHERSGMLNVSISTYKQGISKLSDRPGSVPLLNNLALLYLKEDDTQQAVSYANRALKLAPGDPNVLDTVGWVYYNIKDFDKAIPYLEQATGKLPDFALFHYHLGLGYYNAGKLSEAKSELEIALSKGENAPWAAEVRNLLADISSR